ncbi:MAG: VOC family protein [Beijerinckiaceae bacterium]|nr:VOC family protein [Beijerinckiaceae bacterium]
MFSKINHVAIVSQNYALLARFYEAVFKMKPSSKERAERAQTVGDGYVGLNINPRKAGRPAGLDHFGVEVEDVNAVFDRMKKYQDASWVQRPGTRPFAGITANDPDGNVFDLSQRDMANRSAIYTENAGERRPRFISHIAMRTMHPEKMADFYRDVLQLVDVNKEADDENMYLTDGKVTLVLVPWKINNYLGQSILPTGMDHIVFTVEDLQAFKDDLDNVIGINPIMNTVPVGLGKEQGARLQLLKRQCPAGEHFIADPDFTMLGVRAAM